MLHSETPMVNTASPAARSEFGRVKAMGQNSTLPTAHARSTCPAICTACGVRLNHETSVSANRNMPVLITSMHT